MSIRVANITKQFGRFTALDRVSLTIPDGQLVALLGPSGSGKSTLLRIIAGLEVADASEPGPEIHLGGSEVSRTSVSERRIGFVFQHYALFRHMTVFENIAFGLRVMPRGKRPGKAEIAARVNELLGLMQIDSLGGRLPSQLSGGQRQRVALARALATRPSVLLLDEPFGALDAKVRQDLRKWLRRLHDEIHVTSVFVTHDQEEALELADRVVVMNAGRIEQEGTPDELFHHPATPFVAEFLGQVNLLRGRVQNGETVLSGPGEGKGANGFVAAGLGDGGRLYIRPHEIELSAAPGSGAIAVTLRRVRLAGPTVKVEAVGPHDQPMDIELSHASWKLLSLSAGDRAYARPSEVRVFPGDYTI